MGIAHSARTSLPAALALATWLSAVAGAAPEPPLRLTASTPTPQVRCGDPVMVRVELRNAGRLQVRVYLRGLRIDSAEGGHLSLEPVPGSADVVEQEGREPWLKVGRAPEGARYRYVRIEPGGSALLEATDPLASLVELGRQTRSYRLYGDDPDLSKALEMPASADVELDVQPSDLMVVAWKARTPEQVRQALPAFLELLRGAGTPDGARHLRTNLRYLASAALPLLDMALQEDVPQVRASALSAYGYAVWAVGSMTAVRRDYGRRGYRPAWLAQVPRGHEEEAQRSMLTQARRALGDGSGTVRAAAVRALGGRRTQDFLALTRDMAKDPSPEVRKALLDSLADLVADPEAARRVADAVTDPDEGVRAEALRTLETSPVLPPPAVLADLLRRVRGDVGLRVVALLRQQESEALPAMLEPGFAGRTASEQEAILTAVAGHADGATLRLVRLGLGASGAAVQRAALLRLLPFPAETARPALDAARDRLAPELAALAQEVRTELAERRVFPFLARRAGPLAVALEQEFPAQHGTLPLASPDGRWVAYQDIGGTRPGGTGGMGRSNLVSLVHAVRADGTGDRILSDMFLRGWLADSQRVASARDGFAAITDLDGRVVAELGEPYTDTTPPADEPADWRKREMRQQLGTGRMPHKMSLTAMRLSDGEWGEKAAFSPDGKLFGPLRTPEGTLFLASEGNRRLLTSGEGPAGGPVAWGPAGDVMAHVNADRHLTVFNYGDLTVSDLGPAEPPPTGRWAGDPVWRPWDRDGRRLTFVRDGQVWVCSASGADARQLTFDSTPKRFPVFSPDGSRIAYIAYQTSGRQYVQAPADAWVVDVRTALAVRVTGPDGCRTAGLDWLDGQRLIYDRLGGRTNPVPSPSLRVADLALPPGR